jgi:CheY-like chemotaxis protein
MDDEEIVLQVGSAMMRRIGFEVETAVEGAEAIEKYREAFAEGRRFDLVVLDLTIPGGLGGKEAISALLEIDPAVKAIVSSGYSNDPIMADHARYGFSAVLVKPYRLDDVTAVIRQVIGGD